MSVIEFNNVSKKFRKGERFNSLRDTIPNIIKKFTQKKNNGELEKQEFWAVNDVSFDVQKGDVLGIIGPNGAGKSTILKLLSRILSPNNGHIKIHGRLSALIEVGAGFHNELTGRENIYLNGTILGMNRKEIDERLDQIIDFSGISEFIDTPIKRYSSGMYSRLGFSVAAHMNPDILIVDEVLSVGDMFFQSKCIQKMRELLDSGITIIIVSHNVNMVQNLCKRVILLNKGTVVKDGKPNEVIPLYQRITDKQREEELRKKISQPIAQNHTNKDIITKISNVEFFTKDQRNKQSFSVHEAFSVKFEYDIEGSLEYPIFEFTITRSDNVACCASTTKECGIELPKIEGKGEVIFHLEDVNLAAGSYYIEIAIWDKNSIHLYLLRQSDLFSVEPHSNDDYSHAVFLPKVKWEV